MQLERKALQKGRGSSYDQLYQELNMEFSGRCKKKEWTMDSFKIGRKLGIGLHSKEQNSIACDKGRPFMFCPSFFFPGLTVLCSAS